MVKRVTSKLRDLSVRALPLSVAVAFTCGCAAEAPRDEENIAVETSAITSKVLLLHRWGPIHYQDVNKSSRGLGGKADYITRFNYEPESNSGDWWNAWDKWDNLSGSGNALSGFVYGSVIETASHWFLYYMMYHARDWCDIPDCEEHENDAEGMLLAIRKDWTDYGKLEAMVTIAHEGLHAYSADLATVWPKDGVAREIQWEPFNGEFHPATYQQAEGHATLGCSDLGSKCYKPNEDGIRYVPNGIAQDPGTVGVWTTRSYYIGSIDEMWQHRFDPLMFNQNQVNPPFNGNESGTCGAGAPICSSNKADPMWRGLTGNDPAQQLRNLFEFRQGVPPPTLEYLRNDFKGCEDITVVKSTPGNTPQSCIPGCTGLIAAHDPYCATAEWDQICVDEIVSICGIQASVDPW